MIVNLPSRLTGITAYLGNGGTLEPRCINDPSRFARAAFRGFPGVLKAYIDHIVRVGVTVSSDNVGLLTGKKATVILATGGDFSPGSRVEGYNQASGYLRQVLGYIGITDVEIILAGRPRAGPMAKRRSSNSATRSS